MKPEMTKVLRRKGAAMQHPFYTYVLPMGKYKGKTLAQVIQAYKECRP